MKSSTPLHALYLVPCHCLATASYTLWTWSLSTDGSASAIGTPPSSSVASFVSPTAAAVRRLSGHAGHERTFSFFSNTVPSCAVTVALAAFALAFAAALAAFFASFFAAFLLNTTASPSAARASTSSAIAFAITLPVRFAAGVRGKGPHRPTAPIGPTSPNPRRIPPALASAAAAAARLTSRNSRLHRSDLATRASIASPSSPRRLNVREMRVSVTGGTACSYKSAASPSTTTADPTGSDSACSSLRRSLTILSSPGQTIPRPSTMDCSEQSETVTNGRSKAGLSMCGGIHWPGP